MLFGMNIYQMQLKYQTQEQRKATSKYKFSYINEKIDKYKMLLLKLICLMRSGKILNCNAGHISLSVSNRYAMYSNQTF